VSAAASIGVHLARHGYQIRLVTDSGPGVSTAMTGSRDANAGADFEGALLDALSLADTSVGATFSDAAAALRRGGGDGLLLAVLGEVDPEEVHRLARLRQGSSVAIAVLLDTATWTAHSEMSRARAAAAYDGSVTLLRSAGWRVLCAGAGSNLADVWTGAANQQGGARSGLPAPPGPARGGAADPVPVGRR
jgi:hypothetical protein